MDRIPSPPRSRSFGRTRRDVIKTPRDVIKTRDVTKSRDSARIRDRDVSSKELRNHKLKKSTKSRFYRQSRSKCRGQMLAEFFIGVPQDSPNKTLKFGILSDILRPESQQISSFLNDKFKL